MVAPYSQSSRVEIVKTPKIFFYDTGLLQMLWLKELPKNILGNMLETSIFSELTKNFGADNVYFWRNRNQNEIDFILQKNNFILPIEVKKNFQNLKPKTIQNFCHKYNLKKFIIAGLHGEKNNSYNKYPWEI